MSYVSLSELFVYTLVIIAVITLCKTRADKQNPLMPADSIQLNWAEPPCKAVAFNYLYHLFI